MAEPTGRAPQQERDAEDRVRGRRTFGPVVLLGLSSAGLAAVASAKPWIGGPTDGAGADATMAAADTGARYPLASAVSLVLLAAWGVVLVTRGLVRRVFALLAALSALALVGCVVAGYLTLPDSAGDRFEELMGRSQDTGFTGWFWTTAVVALLALVPAALAVRLVPHWPEMGSRYDAPAGAVEQSQTQRTSRDPAQDPPHDRGQQRPLDTDRDLWMALDEGRDPTDGERG